jgi:hypothetical protein
MSYLSTDHVENSWPVIRIHVASHWSFLMMVCGPCWDRTSVTIWLQPLSPYGPGSNRWQLLVWILVCEHNTNHINPWWCRLRQSLKHRIPTPHWHSQLPEKTSLCAVDMRISNQTSVAFKKLQTKYLPGKLFLSFRMFCSVVSKYALATWCES